jgi:hypothetical protein
VQRLDAFGESRTAGVPDPEDRHPFADGHVVGVHDVLAALAAHRAALETGVTAERDDGNTLDAAHRGEHAALVLRGDQPQRALVEQRGQAYDRVPGIGRLRIGALLRCSVVEHGH